MALDLPTIRAARFPATVDHAIALLGTNKPTPCLDHTLLRELLSSSDGARGALVAVLSDPSIPHCDLPVDPDFAAVLSHMARCDHPHADTLRTLLVKNLVMPTAMTVTYANQNNTQLAQASEMTATRAANLLTLVADDHRVKHIITDFINGLEHDQGRFGTFAQKWAYGQEQRQKAINALRQTLRPS